MYLFAGLVKSCNFELEFIFLSVETMKKVTYYILALFVMSSFSSLYADNNVGIGTENPDNSALLHLESTEQGLLMPRMTGVQRDAIVSPVKGLIIFNTDVGDFQFYTGTEWTTLPESIIPNSSGELLIWDNNVGDWAVAQVSGSQGIVVTNGDGSIDVALPAGNAAGDILKYNATAAKWESSALDVSIFPSGNSAGDLLIWDETNGEWDFNTITSDRGIVVTNGNGSIDVALPEGTAAGQLMIWDNDASTWEPANIASSRGIVVTNGNGSINVALPTGSDGHILKYNGTSAQWESSVLDVSNFPAGNNDGDLFVWNGTEWIRNTLADGDGVSVSSTNGTITISGDYTGSTGISITGNTISLPTGSNENGFLRWSGTAWGAGKLALSDFPAGTSNGDLFVWNGTEWIRNTLADGDGVSVSYANGAITISGDYTGSRGISITGNTISLPEGTNAGQFLRWNGTNEWVVNSLAAGTGVTFNDNSGTLTISADSQFPTGTSGQHLVHNGSEWSSTTLSGGNGLTVNASGTEISLPSGTNAGDFLRWNGTNEWVVNSLAEGDGVTFTDNNGTLTISADDELPATATDGQILQYFSSDWSAATISAGAGIAISNNSGTIEISSTVTIPNSTSENSFLRGNGSNGWENQTTLWIDDNDASANVTFAADLGTNNRTYTFPDAGENANIVLTESTSGQTIDGGLNVEDGVEIDNALTLDALNTNNRQLIFSENNATPTEQTSFTAGDQTGVNYHYILPTDYNDSGNDNYPAVGEVLTVKSVDTGTETIHLEWSDDCCNGSSNLKMSDTYINGNMITIVDSKPIQLNLDASFTTGNVFEINNAIPSRIFSIDETGAVSANSFVAMNANGLVSGFKAGNNATDLIYTLPVEDGTSGQVLSTNGSGVLSWIDNGSGSGNSLDQAYDLGSTITVDASAFQLTTDGTVGNTLVINDGTEDVFTVDDDGKVTSNNLFLRSSLALSSTSATPSTTTLKAGDNATPLTFTLPNGAGTNGQVLSTDGNGALSWVDSGSSSSFDDAYGEGSDVTVDDDAISFSADDTYTKNVLEVSTEGTGKGVYIENTADWDTGGDEGKAIAFSNDGTNDYAFIGYDEDNSQSVVVLKQLPSNGSQYPLQITADGRVVRDGSSSRRYKTNIRNLDIDTEKLYDLRPVSFTYKANGAEAFGLIAEEVEPLFPELVIYNSKGIVDGVAYQNLNVLMLNELQKQKKTIELQEERLTKLEAELEEIKKLLIKNTEMNLPKGSGETNMELKD